MKNKTLLEEAAVGKLVYQRYRYDSKTLGRTENFGILCASGLDPSLAERFLYLFHAGNGDDRQWIQEGIASAIQGRALDLILQKNIVVVMPFIGTSFLHDFPGKSERAVSTSFFEEFMPGVEAGSTQIKDRYLYGISMGGFAALSAFFRRPEKFSGVSAQMPALFSFDYMQPSEVEAFVNRTHTPHEAIQFLLSLLRPEFTDLADFHSFNPIELAKKADAENLDGKKICFDVGDRDSFGCFEGSDQLHQLLLDKKIEHHYEKVPGGLHDAGFVTGRISGMMEKLLG